jgi:hypothetical protein
MSLYMLRCTAPRPHNHLKLQSIHTSQLTTFASHTRLESHCEQYSIGKV